MNLPALIVLAAAVLVFVVLLKTLHAARAGRTVLETGQSALAALQDPTLSDAEKEAAARAAAGRLFRGFLAIGAIAVVALAVPAALVWAGSALGLYALDDALSLAAGWPFLLASTLVAVAAWATLERLA